jgi:hypothetical protein
MGVGVAVAVWETDIHKGWLRGGGIVFGVWGCIVGDVEAGRGEEEFEWGEIGSGAVVFDVQFLCAQRYLLFNEKHACC